MTADITLQPMPVLAEGYDLEGRLVLANGMLVAVIVHLDRSEYDPEIRGRWHLEAGFGKCNVSPCRTPLWNDPGDAVSWVREKLAHR